MTTTTVPTSAAPRPMPLWLRMAGRQIAGYAMILGGFLLATIAVAVVALALISRSMTPTMSALQFAQQAAPWFGFGVAIHYVVVWLGPHLVAGMTRRAFVKAAVTATLGYAALGALTLAALLHAERWVYGLLGWSAGSGTGGVAGTDVPVAGYLWGLFLVLLIASLTGLVVGLTYARLGAVATFALPLSMLPLVLGTLFAFSPASGFSLLFVSTRGSAGAASAWAPGAFVAGGVVAGPLIAAATVVAVHLLARRLPVRSPRA